jgi:hypothetical protein
LHTWPRWRSNAVCPFASLKPGDLKRFAKLKKQPGDLPTGVVAGSVEIAGCKGEPGNYRWRLTEGQIARHVCTIFKGARKWGTSR